MAPRNHKRRPYVIRLVHARWRLFFSATIGLVSIFLLPHDWRLVTRMLVGWDIGISLYIALCAWMFARCDTNHIREQSARQDEGRYMIPLATVGAALASVAAIFIELRTAAGSPTNEPRLLALGVVTILLSWTFIHTIFTLHYAHEYYAVHRGQGRGLKFPGDGKTGYLDKPGYWDFVYFSFVIGMTSQVSDVAVSSNAMRKIVSAHGMVAFIFNVALLALTINIAASAM
jgi:uncharacterized membrane protein